MKTYDYLVFPALDTCLILGGIREKDSYVSTDKVSNALANTLSAGYRWVRTDGEFAIFEKEITVSSEPMTISDLEMSQITKQLRSREIK